MKTIRVAHETNCNAVQALVAHQQINAQHSHSILVTRLWPSGGRACTVIFKDHIAKPENNPNQPIASLIPICRQ